MSSFYSPEVSGILINEAPEKLSWNLSEIVLSSLTLYGEFLRRNILSGQTLAFNDL